jgi:hypothetical protein
MTKLYRVVASQLVYHECYIEADNEEDALEIAQDDWLDWKEIALGDWEIEDVEFQTQAKISSSEITE